MDKFIQRALTRSQINEILQFLSYHLGYTPPQKFTIIFAKTPEQFAKLHGTEPGQTTVEEINSAVPTLPAIFDHGTNTAVFQGFSYVQGLAVPHFIIPMATILHECIHFYQYSAGNFGSWQTMYEGTSEILACFFADDYQFDYKNEVIYSFNLAMIINDNNFWEAMNWIKRYTVHSDKNGFVARSILQTPTFAKFRPTNLMRWLDANTLHKIKNEEIRNLFTKYNLSYIKKQLHKNRQLIS
jgi:hypothetical protein